MNNLYQNYLETRQNAKIARDILLNKLSDIVENGPRQGMTLVEIMNKMSIHVTPSSRSSIASLLIQNGIGRREGRYETRRYVMLDDDDEPNMDTIREENHVVTYYLPSC